MFCDDGVFAEMSLDLKDYTTRTAPIDGIVYGLYVGNAEKLRDRVALVNEKWCRYFREGTRVFCGYAKGDIVSFCIVESDADCILSNPAVRVGSIGCVGTLPEYRGRGIGLRMVDLATLWLKDERCDKAYVSYTHLDFWYERLGYVTFARFSLV